MDGWMDRLKKIWLGGYKKIDGWLDGWIEKDSWIVGKIEKMKNQNCWMVRWIGEKKMDGWIHCWVVSWWIETKNGWLDVQIFKNGQLDGQRKNMD